MMSDRKMRPKKCRHCGSQFKPQKPLQVACSISCALELAKAKEQRKRLDIQKRERREIKARKEALKPRSNHLKEAQAAFNRFIRLRDRNEPCICCGSYGPGEDWLTGGKWDAGHYLSRGAYPELRFDEDNCHKQLKSCNAGSSKYAKKGRTVSQGYRLRLIEKIGLERVEWLEGPHEPKKYTVDDLKAIKAEYRAKARELMKAEAV